MNFYFAGAIFTPQEVFLFLASVFIVVGIITGAAIFFIKKILSKNTNKPGTKVSLPLSVQAGFGLVAAAVLILFVIPTSIKDNAARKKEEDCAKKAGYNAAWEDNSTKATPESQTAFRNCLGIKF